MKQLIAISMSIIIYAPLWASFTKAQTGVAGSATTGTTVSCTFANNPATGDLVTVGLLWFNGTSSSSTLTVKDSNNNVYTVDSNNSQLTNVSTAGEVGQAYLLSAPSNASKTITSTFDVACGGDCAIWCDDWAPSSSGVFDSSNKANGTSAINAPTVTVSSSAELVYCTASDGNSVGAAGSPFTANEGGPKFNDVSAWANGQSANTACNFAGTASVVWNAVGMSFSSASFLPRGKMAIIGGKTSIN